MKIIVKLSLLTWIAYKGESKVYLVSTNATNEQQKDAEEIVFNNLSDVDEGNDYQAAPVRIYNTGTDMKFKCNSIIDMIDCQFKSPTGKIHQIGISGKAYSSGRVRNLHGVSWILFKFLEIDSPT